MHFLMYSLRGLKFMTEKDLPLIFILQKLSVYLCICFHLVSITSVKQRLDFGPPFR